MKMNKNLYLNFLKEYKFALDKKNDFINLCKLLYNGSIVKEENINLLFKDNFYGVINENETLIKNNVIEKLNLIIKKYNLEGVKENNTINIDKLYKKMIDIDNNEDF